MNRAGAVAATAFKRLAVATLLACGASAIIYFTIRLAPGDAIDAVTPMGTPEEMRDKLAADFGLDQGPGSGFVSWLLEAAQGNLGQSLVFSPGTPVLEEAVPVFLNSLVLAFAALFVCLGLSLLLASYSVDETPLQRRLLGPIYVLTTAPCFVVAVFMIAAINRFVRRFIDQAGYVPPEWYALPKATDSVVPMVFAGVVLVIGDGLFMDTFNYVRAQLKQVWNAQFIAAVRAKGANPTPHVVKNMIVPVASCFASRFPVVLGGVVIVEYIFSLNGAGYTLLEAARLRDFPLVVGICLLFTVAVIAVHLVADVLRASVDPREVARGG